MVELRLGLLGPRKPGRFVRRWMKHGTADHPAPVQNAFVVDPNVRCDSVFERDFVIRRALLIGAVGWQSNGDP
jgi:hypothetical protein